MAVYDGTDAFTGNVVSGNKLDTTVLWHGTALPVGAANKVPQYGIFRLVDSLSAPTTSADYIQTSATLSSPVFVKFPSADGLPLIDHTSTLSDYTIPDNGGSSSVDMSNSDEVQTTVCTNGTAVNVMWHETRHGVVYKVLTGNACIGKYISNIEWYLQKTGTPTGSAYGRVFNGGNESNVKGTFATIDVATMGAGAMYKFTNNNTSVPLALNDYIGVYEGTFTQASGNYIRTGTQGTDFDSTWDGYQINHSDGNMSASTNGEASCNLFSAGDSMVSDNTGTKLQTQSETNAWVLVSYNSPVNIAGLAIHPHANSTVTEVKIQTSLDGTTWTDKRTITWSNITEGAWNYIRFNLSYGTHVRVYSTGSGILSINEMRAYTPDASKVASDHQHLEISATDTSLALDGT